MKKPFARVGAALMVLILLPASACGLTAQKTDSAQTYMTVEEYYDGMAIELRRNPTRLKSLVGKISTVRRRDNQNQWGKYSVSCRFPSIQKGPLCNMLLPNDNGVLSLNIGDYVAVEGVLEVAFPNTVPLFDEVGAVKLSDCRRVARR